jgi:hypothetical protein
MTVKLQQILTGRREFLDLFGGSHPNPQVAEFAREVGRQITEQFQGLAPDQIYSQMRADYQNLLGRAESLRTLSSDPEALDLQVKYIQRQLERLEDWKAAGFPE